MTLRTKSLCALAVRLLAVRSTACIQQLILKLGALGTALNSLVLCIGACFSQVAQLFTVLAAPVSVWAGVVNRVGEALEVLTDLHEQAQVRNPKASCYVLLRLLITRLINGCLHSACWKMATRFACRTSRFAARTNRC